MHLKLIVLSFSLSGDTEYKLLWAEMINITEDLIMEEEKKK